MHCSTEFTPWNTVQLCNNKDESHRCNFEQKKQDTKEWDNVIPPTESLKTKLICGNRDQDRYYFSESTWEIDNSLRVYVGCNCMSPNVYNVMTLNTVFFSF